MFFCRDVYGGEARWGVVRRGCVRRGRERCSQFGAALSESGAHASERRSSESGVRPAGRSGTLGLSHRSSTPPRAVLTLRSGAPARAALSLRSSALAPGRSSPSAAWPGCSRSSSPRSPARHRRHPGPHGRRPALRVGRVARLAPSYDLTGHAFDPHRDRRGPAWFNTNWLLERGLRLHGEHGRGGVAGGAAGDGGHVLVRGVRGSVHRRGLRRARLQLDGRTDPGPAARARASRPSRSGGSGGSGGSVDARRVPSGHCCVHKAQGTPPHASRASHTPHTPHSSFETGAKGGDRG